jgi:DHA1 family tetracycline resistance protein-like MFS transporter
MMFAFTIVYCLGGIAGPALQGIISTQVPANEQGELQGALTSLISVTTIIGPLIMTSTFFYFAERGTSHYMPGAPMLLGAFLTLISTYLARRTLKRSMITVSAKAET